MSKDLIEQIQRHRKEVGWDTHQIARGRYDLLRMQPWKLEQVARATEAAAKRTQRNTDLRVSKKPRRSK